MVVMATGGPTDRFLFFFPSLSLSLLNAHTHKHRHTFSFSFFPPSLLSSLFICSHNREGGGGKGKKKKAGVGRGILVALQDWVWYCAVLLYCQTLWNTSSGLFLIFFFFFFFPGVVFFSSFSFVLRFSFFQHTLLLCCRLGCLWMDSMAWWRERKVSGRRGRVCGREREQKLEYNCRRKAGKRTKQN